MYSDYNTLTLIPKETLEADSNTTPFFNHYKRHVYVLEGGLVGHSITIGFLALQYKVIVIGTRSCHFYENFAIPQRTHLLVHTKAKIAKMGLHNNLQTHNRKIMVIKLQINNGWDYFWGQIRRGKNCTHILSNKSFPTFLFLYLIFGDNLWHGVLELFLSCLQISNYYYN